jgi:hypothetical protein
LKRAGVSSAVLVSAGDVQAALAPEGGGRGYNRATGQWRRRMTPKATRAPASRAIEVGSGVDVVGVVQRVLSHEAKFISNSPPAGIPIPPDQV